MLFGTLAGQLLQSGRTIEDKASWMFFSGNLLLFGGLMLSTWMPINKKLWTSSFTLFMAGLDFTLFAFFLWCADERGWGRCFRPMVIMGMNAIAVYMASELVDTLLSVLGWREVIYKNLFLAIASPLNASLLYAVVFMLSMYAIAYVLYKRKIFLKA